jgi:hypothetical protein
LGAARDTVAFASCVHLHVGFFAQFGANGFAHHVSTVGRAAGEQDDSGEKAMIVTGGFLATKYNVVLAA